MKILGLMLIALFAQIVFAAQVGEKVSFQRGKTFHIEFRVVCDSEEVRAHRERELGIRKENPVSYMYGISRYARNGVSGFVFAQNLHANIRVDGYTGPAQTFDLVDRSNVKIGTVTPSNSGTGFIEFQNFSLGDGAIGIVLPFSFGQEPVLTVTPVGWQPTGITVRNGVYQVGFSHRTSPAQKVNTGFVPEVLPKCS